MLRHQRALVILPVLVLSLVLAGISAAETYKIGGNLSLTGGAAFYGQVIREGIEQAVGEVNQARKGFTLETVYEDHKFSPKDVASAMNKLVSVDKVLTVLVNGSTPTLVSAPIADRAQVILINGGAVSPRLAGAGKFLFNVIPNGTIEVERMSEYLSRQMGSRRLAVIHTNDDFGVAMKDVAAVAFAKLGGTIVTTQGYDPKAIDFSAHIAKVKQASPDAVYLLSTAQEGGLVLKQSRELGLTVPFVSYSAFQNPDLLTRAGSAAEGVLFTSPSLDFASADPKVQAFVSTYRVKHGREPELYAANYYDAVHMVARAIEALVAKKQLVTGEAVRAKLYELREFDGVTGKTILRDDGTVDKPLSLKKVENGKFVIAAPVLK